MIKSLIVLLFLTIVPPAFGQANLTWIDNNTTPSETGFVVERQLNGGAFTVLAASLAANIVSYTDSTAVGSTAQANTYCYRVKTFDATQQTAYSNTACKTFSIIIPPLNPPTGLKVSAISPTEVQISWNDSPYETGIQAERTANGQSKILDYDMNQVAAIDSGLRRNTWHEYRVRNLYDAGTSTWSNRVKVKTPR